MNKKAFRIAGWALGLSLAITGVGLAAGSFVANDSNQLEVLAAPTTVTWDGTTTALPGTATAIAGDSNVKIKTSSTNSYTNPARLYAGSTVTITAATNIVLKSVTFVASSTGSYVTNAQEATVSPAVTPEVDNKNVVWSFTTEVTAFTITPAAQTRWNSISVTYDMKAGSKTIEATSVAITNGDINLDTAESGDTIDYDATVTYREGDGYENGSGTVTWESSDEDVATIDPETGVVTIVGAGETTIKATCNDGGSPYDEVSLSIDTFVLPTSFSIAATDFTGTFGYDKTLTNVYSGLNDLSNSPTSITIQETNCLKNSTNLQSNSGKGSSVANLTAIPGRIATITATFTASSKNSTCLYLSNGSVATADSDDSLDGSSEDEVQVFDVAGLGNFNYFFFDLSGVTGAVYFTLEVTYEIIPPELSLDAETVTIYKGAVDNTVTVGYDFDCFDATPVISKASANTTILPLANITIDTVKKEITITSGSVVSTAGVLVTITATNNEQVATDTLLVKVYPGAEDLIGIEVTSNPTKTAYNTGETLDLSGAVITATYDDGGDGLEVNVTGECEFDPADGAEITAEMSTVTVSFGGEVTSFSLTITVTVNYVRATSMNQIYDGQEVVLANESGTYASKVYGSANGSSDNNIRAAAITPVNGKIVSTDLTENECVTYTLRRENYDSDDDGIVDSTAWVLFDGSYYLYPAGTSNNYLKGKTTLDKDCYWSISFEGATLNVVGLRTGGYRTTMQFNSSLFSCYASASQSPVAFYVKDVDASGTSAAKAFNDIYMHMDANVSGQCNTYYPIAKAVWNDLLVSAREAFITNHPASYTRLQNWAAAKNDVLNDSTHALENQGASIGTVSETLLKDRDSAVIAAIAAGSTLVLGGAAILLRKRRGAF